MKSRERLARFQNVIWNYYGKHERDLPWHKNVTPYRVFVSEVMLQQTQAGRVEQKFELFVKQFPGVRALARTPQSAVLAAWQGLGYNRLALALKRVAEIIVREYYGKFPRDIELLQQLPGIGRATAGAVCAFAFNIPTTFIETNIRRAFIHFFFPRKNKVDDREIMPFIQATVPRTLSVPKRGKAREWYYALMDYGAMLGKKRHGENPNRRSAHYARQSPFKESRREIRGRMVKLLLERGNASEAELGRIMADVPIVRIRDVLVSLDKEGFLSRRRGRYFLSRG